MSEPTGEQKKIIDYALSSKNNCVVVAKPGSGKTFTLAKIISQTIPNLPNYAGVIAISYTRKASKELEHRCLSSGLDPKGSFFGTIDSFFLREIIYPFLPHIWGQPKIALDTRKFEEMVEKGEIEEIAAQRISKDLIDDQIAIPSIAMQDFKHLFSNGIVLLNSVGKLASFVFNRSYACRRYLKARYKQVIVDEYQDSGYEQHALFLELSRLGLQSIAVGDFDQSIYKFAKKDSRFLKELANDETFKTFPISKNHRCHPSIINYSLRLMDKRAELLQADQNRIAHRIITGSEIDCAKWIGNNIDVMKAKTEIKDNKQVAVLCRSSRTVDLVRKNIGIPSKTNEETSLDRDNNDWSLLFADILHVIFDPNVKKTDFIDDHFVSGASKKDINQVFKILSELENIANSSIDSLSNEMLRFKEIASILKRDGENPNSLSLLSEVISSSSQLKNYMPALSHEITIMTLHKSKGLEFDFVIHMDLYDWIMPGFEYIKNGNEQEYIQDLNLHYVGITRAKKACLLLTSTQRHNAALEIKRADPSRFLILNGVDSLRG